MDDTIDHVAAASDPLAVLDWSISFGLPLSQNLSRRPAAQKLEGKSETLFRLE